MPRTRPHIFCLTAAGMKQATTIATHVDGVIRSSTGTTEYGDAIAFDSFPTALRETFLSGIPIIGICSAGILIRIIAPLLGSKSADPPVVCIAENGSTVIPLLGGHRGANSLALEIAGHLDAHAAITTASDLHIGMALDEPPDGWKLAQPADTKSMTMAVLAGKKILVTGQAAWTDPLLKLGNVEQSDNGSVDGQVIIQSDDSDAVLIYRKQVFVIGVGCSRNCPPEELIALVGRVMADAGIAGESINGIYTAVIKSDEPAVHALGEILDVPVRFFESTRLEEETPRLKNPSDLVFATVGSHGVAEAAALAAVGRDGYLVVEKQKTSNATCAIAKSNGTITTGGRKRGRLSIVGIGPGGSEWRTVQAMRAISGADHVVGYRRYLEMIESQIADKECTSFELGEEIERCRFALESASGGRNVVLVCSGDSGIYAMAAPVMELIDKGGDTLSEGVARVEITCVPGISAMQAASARSGAILGHDFCAISLSDLLTPTDVILERVRAAAAGDFVTAFYNPASQRRKALIDKALQIMIEYRPRTTPVLIARHVGRPDENSTVHDITSVPLEDIDMFATVIVGNSESRTTTDAFGHQHVYTPRGYRGHQPA